MTKKPDLSDLTKKFDLNNIVGSLKSLINPTAGTPDVKADDAIGIKIAQISVLAQQLSKAAADQAIEFNKLNQLLNGLYEDIERLRQEHGSSVSAADESVTQTKTPHATTHTHKTSETPHSDSVHTKDDKEK